MFMIHDHFNTTIHQCKSTYSNWSNIFSDHVPSRPKHWPCAIKTETLTMNKNKANDAQSKSSRWTSNPNHDQEILITPGTKGDRIKLSSHNTVTVITPTQIWTAMLTSWSQNYLWTSSLLMTQDDLEQPSLPPQMGLPWGTTTYNQKPNFINQMHNEMNPPQSIHQDTCDLVPEDNNRTNPQVTPKPPGKCDPYIFFLPKHTKILRSFRLCSRTQESVANT